MTTVPPKYPTTPYLWPPDRVERGDAILPAAARRAWLDGPVEVEEKLDGANVAIWWDDGRPSVASRGGPDAMDRARQLGPLRAWVGQSVERVESVCADGWVLYGEWLWLRHTVFYDELPEPLIALDLYHPDDGFVDHVSRRGRLVAAALTPPPLLFEGVLGGRDGIVELMGPSRFGHEPMEGVVLRRGRHGRCKVVRPDFVRATDRELARARNGLCAG